MRYENPSAAKHETSSASRNPDISSPSTPETGIWETMPTVPD